VKADPPDYKWTTTLRPTELSRSAIIEAYIDLFRSSIARCDTQENISLPLSGGQDSRHILLELCQQRRKPQTCWTVDIPWSPLEADIAKQLCMSLHIPHRTFIPKGDITGAETRKNPLTDYSSMQHCWMAEAIMAGLVRKRVVFDGIGGDVLSAGRFMTDARFQMLRCRRFDELVEDIVGPDETVFGIDDDTLFRRWRAVEKVNDEFRKRLGAPDPVSSFYFWNRTRRDIGCSAFSIDPA
jgi:asparagine synthase (glutamine-hydrolysing)